MDLVFTVHCKSDPILFQSKLWSRGCKVLWFDQLAELQARRLVHVGRPLVYTVSMVNPGSGSITAAGTGRLIQIEKRMNSAKYKEVLQENLLQAA